MDIQTLIFDFDYTLADSSQAVIDCIDFALRSLGFDPVSDEMACRTIGLPVAETLPTLVGEQHRDKCPAFARLFQQRADQVMTRKTRLFEYTAPAIHRLGAAGVTLGIVSTKRRHRIEEILARDDLLTPFALIVGGEDVTRFKPDPQSLLLALERLGSDPARTLYVGDSVIDAQAAQNAGLGFVAVLSGTTPREAFEGYPVWAVLQNLSGLAAFIDGRQTGAQDSKTLSRQRYGQFAQGYVNSPSHAQGSDLDRLLDIAQPQPHWRALDVATGGGHTALKFAPHVAEVVASDLTPQMLDAAQAFIAAQGASNIQFKLADAEDLPFEDNSFDLVTCRIAPHHFPHIDQFVCEAARVLKPDGLLLVQDQIVPEDADTAHAVDNFERLRDPSHSHAYSENEWKRAFAATGLTVTHSEEIIKQHQFVQWIERQGCAPETVERLIALLNDAAPSVIAWLQPQQWGTPEATFANHHILIAGRKAETAHPSS